LLAAGFGLDAVFFTNGGNLTFAAFARADIWLAILAGACLHIQVDTWSWHGDAQRQATGQVCGKSDGV